MIPLALNLVSALPWPKEALRIPKLQAHRGHWQAGFQENTLQAFRAAKVAGFEMCELDVQLSKDRVPVVFHDNDLKRLAGRSERVDQLTAAELKKAAQIPTLKEVLVDGAVTEFFNIEIKCPLAKLGKLEKPVREVILEAKAERRVLISSFNPLCLANCSNLMPHIPLALLATHKKEKDNSLLLRQFLIAPFLRIHILHLDEDMLTPEWTTKLNHLKIPFSVWTVNEKSQGDLLLKAGAQSLITDQLKPKDFSPSA